MSEWGEWVRENKEAIRLGFRVLRDWLWPKPEEGGGSSAGSQEQKPGVLILGPGGVGKSTLGKILSGQFDLLFDLPGPYDESIEVERYPIKDNPGLEIVVPPGQPQRRETTWNEHLEGLSTGKFRGMILIGSYGYHNHELGALVSYKDHRLYKGNKEDFRDDFTRDRRDEELKVLREIAPRITPPAGGKFWLLTLATKQDLWWDERAEVENFYKAGAYGAEIDRILARHGARQFRSEVALASLVISNFETGRGEEVQKNTAGYDHRRHVLSLRKIFEMLEALRRWEEEGK